MICQSLFEDQLRRQLHISATCRRQSGDTILLCAPHRLPRLAEQENAVSFLKQYDMTTTTAELNCCRLAKSTTERSDRSIYAEYHKIRRREEGIPPETSKAPDTLRKRLTWISGLIFRQALPIAAASSAEPFFEGGMRLESRMTSMLSICRPIRKPAFVS